MRSGVVFGSLKDDWDQPDQPPVARRAPVPPAGHSASDDGGDPHDVERSDWYAPEDDSLLRRFLFKYMPILLLCVIAYWPAWRGGEFLWMDDVHVTANNPLRSASGLAMLWTSPTVTPDWSPVSYSLLWPQQGLWGSRVPMGYHLVSLFFHTFNAFMVWALLKRLDVPGALVAAIIFALHPLQIEPVAWIARQPMIWGAFWGLAFMLIYLRYAQADNVAVDPSKILRLPETPWMLYAFAVITYVLAALSNPLLVCTLPLVVAVLVWWKRDDFNRSDLLKLLPLIAIGIGVATMHAWVEVRRPGFERVFTGWEVAFVPARAVWFYLLKFVVPIKLSVVYRAWEINPRDILLWMALISLVVIGLALWIKRRDIGRTPIAVFGTYLLLLLPMITPLNRAEMVGGFVADRFHYLATIVLAGVAMLLVHLVLKRLPRHTRQWVGPVAGSVFAFVLMIVAAGGHAGSFANQERLWQNAVAANQNNLDALFRRGRAYHERKEFAKAIADFEEVDRRSGGRNLEAKIALGEIAETHDLKYATWHYQQAVLVAPDKPEPYRKLGAVLAKQKQYDEAARTYKQGLDRFPNDSELHRLMGMAMAYQNKPDEALTWVKKSVDLAPHVAQTRVDYANILQLNKEYAKALEQFNEAIKIDPANFEAFMNAGLLCWRAGNLDWAYNCFRNASFLKKEDADAAYWVGNITWLQARQSWYKGDSAIATAKIKEAGVYFKRATDLRKDFQPAIKNLQATNDLAAAIVAGPAPRTATTLPTQPVIAKPTTKPGDINVEK